ncbi:MAG: AsnC family transcriptional regulator [Candidatus Hodarchaeota archaeon]
MKSNDSELDRLRQSEYDLKERIKELNCLYGISKLAEKWENIDDFLTGVVNLIPPAFQFPEITHARIEYDGKEYSTTNFKDSNHKLTTSVNILNKELLFEAIYTKVEDWLEFEYMLVDDIGKRLKVILETKEEFKKQLLDARLQALTELNKQLEERVSDRIYISDIDDIDRQIINLLNEDGRMKLVELGNHIVTKGKEGYSHVGVRNRITKLIESKSIKIQANVNLKKYKTVMGILLLETGTNEDTTSILEKYENCPRVIFSSLTSGKYNLIYAIIAKNLENLETYLNTCSPKSYSGIRDSMVLITTSFYTPEYFPTRYFEVGEKNRIPCLGPGPVDPEKMEELCQICPAAINYYNK